jgi:hypothetical protein
VELTDLTTYSEDYELHIRQGPERARIAGVKEKGSIPLCFFDAFCFFRFWGGGKVS